MRNSFIGIIAVLTGFHPTRCVLGFRLLGAVPERHPAASRNRCPSDSLLQCTVNLSRLSLSSNNNEEYSREIRLREEAESPLRKVRFFIYVALGAGASVSLAVSLARIGAALSGINQDLMQESLVNAGVDILGLGLVVFLYQRDAKAEEARLKRASKGAELAKLQIRGSKGIISGETVSEQSALETFTTSLASLRRGRGIEKRVVIAAAGPTKIREILDEARKLEQELISSDLLVVPVVLPDGISPAQEKPFPNSVAVPVGFSWKLLMEEEAEGAASQGVDVMGEGFCVIIKKNGRVGQRTKGIFLENTVDEVSKRMDTGMDVTNI